MFNMIYFSFYHNMKQFIPKHVVCAVYVWVFLLLKYPLPQLFLFFLPQIVVLFVSLLELVSSVAV